VIAYADGRTELAPVKLWKNLATWRSDLVSLNSNYDKVSKGSGYFAGSTKVWRGFCPAGDKTSLQAYEWVNPRPEVKIDFVVLRLSPGLDKTILLLLGLTAVE
jgi:hypothetical protein